LEATTMTDDTIALRELLGKGSNATLLHEMIGFAEWRADEEPVATDGFHYHTHYLGNGIG